MRYFKTGPKIGRYNIWGITYDENNKCYLRIATIIKNKEYIGCISGTSIIDALINLFSSKKEIVSGKQFLTA